MSLILEITDAGGLIPFTGSTGNLTRRIANFDAACRRSTDAKGRTVTDAHELSLKRVDAWMKHAIKDAQEEYGQQQDAFTPAMGMFNPRDLTYKFQRVMEERLPPLNIDMVLPVNTEVPPTAASYEQSRMYTVGEAVAYRGGMGDDVPSIELGQTSFQQPVIWLISRFDVDFLSAMRAQHVGLDVQARKLAGARRVMAERRNEWCWFGASAYNLFGLLNNPYLDTAVSQVAYNEDSSAQDIIDDFNYWAQLPMRTSQGAFKPDTVTLSIDTYTFLASTPRNAQSASDTTILEFLKKANPHIKNWLMAGECDNALSAGVHAMVFTCRGAGGQFDHSAEIIDVMPPTLLAPERRALGDQFFLVQAVGGVNLTSAGDNLAVYVQGRA